MSEVLDRLKAALADRYAVERELGSGGMATVYLADDLKHDRRVAVKVLHPELAAVLGAERFLNEIKVTANLQHPHILPLHDSGEAEGFVYYVMPYVEGETLRMKLEREKELSVDETIEIARAVASALDHAHRHNVIHRDIKPENILLQDGQPVVADFGIALAMSAAGGSRLTETGLSVGTPQYMSPEQATGDRELDSRSDIYSLGCVVYEMLVGEPPYTGPTAQAIIAKVVTEKTPDVTASRETVPPHVALAVKKSLAKLPADRFGAAAEFAEALKQAGPVPRLDYPAVETVAQAAVPRRWMDWRLAALGVVAAVAIGLALWGWMRQPAPRRVMRFTITFAAGQDIAPGFGKDVALAPDGSSLAYVGYGGADVVKLWLRRFDQLEAAPINGTGGAMSPFFSPDGQSVAFFNSPMGLRVVSLAGGPPLTLTDSAVPTGGDWGPDGMLYFSCCGERSGRIGISRIPAAGGDFEVITTPDTASGERAHICVDVLPNGQGALFTIWRSHVGDSDVAVVDLEGGEVKVLVRGATCGRYDRSGQLVYARADGALAAAPFDPQGLELTGPSIPLIEGIQMGWGGWAAQFTLSDDGTLLYLGGPPPPEELLWVERDGTERPIAPDLKRDFEEAAFSPDGRFLALSISALDGPRDIWTYDLDAGTASRLSFEGEVNDIPVWSPDGSRVAFRSDRSGLWAFYTKTADGSGPAELLEESTWPITSASWSPDGHWLAYAVRGRSTGGDILYIRPGVDSVARTFLATDANERNPRLSPDGRWLAYVSDETGLDEVYVRPFPGPGGQRQVSTDGGLMPLWAHSGRELFYRSGAGEFVVAEVQTEPTFSVQTRRVLFDFHAGYELETDLTPYDITADDRRFVMIKNVTAGRSPVIVLNWVEELQQRVGN